MKIKHKNSTEIISEFPNYGQHYNGMYGDLIVTHEMKILFYFVDYHVGEGGSELASYDVTDEYEFI